MDNPKIIGDNRQPDGKFGPGNIANPNGRPKGSFSLVEMIKKKLQEVPEGKDKTYAQFFIEQLMKKAVIEGDTQMMRDMINRVDGFPKGSTDLTTGGEKLNVNVIQYLPQKEEKE